MIKNNAIQKLERIYVIGLVIPTSIDGDRYTIGFIDEFRCYVLVKLLKHKAQALQAMKGYVAQYGRPEIFGELIKDRTQKQIKKAFKSFYLTKKHLVNSRLLKHPSKMVLQNVSIEQN